MSNYQVWRELLNRSIVGKSSGPLGMHEVWRREVSKNYGLVTSFCVDPWGENWLTMGCTNRQLMLWDLR
uniref:WD_REPEATS_REGION domain-containing protein n=1 Tax=Heterorhabditis bacteriophora TaxID=37862 RepID=A0A1I7XE81_HETBA